MKWLLIAGGLGLLSCGALTQVPLDTPTDYVNWEIFPAAPLAISPDHTRLAVCNLPDARVELLDISSAPPVLEASIPVGLNPVAVRFRDDSEAWAVNSISDSVSVIDLEAGRVKFTLQTGDFPADLVFAGQPARAYVSCSQFNRIQVFDPESYALVDEIEIKGNRPKALAVSPDGTKVYVAILESGNATTILAPRFGDGFREHGPAEFPDGPYGGLNPPPNDGGQFNPAIDSDKFQDLLPPRVSLIVRRNPEGRWMDDNDADWTDYVSGSQSIFGGRQIGWDMPDRDLAVIDTQTRSVRYATGLMTLCMALGVHPKTGAVTLVGTEAFNEIRFEPRLNGVFSKVMLARVDPDSLSAERFDLNPHLDYLSHTIAETERLKSIGDPRSVLWDSQGETGYVGGMGSGNIVTFDSNGNRSGVIQLEAGVTGLALDEPNQRLFALNSFSNRLRVVDLQTREAGASIALHDPTPGEIKKGRPHLYDTHATSGNGHVSCATCHVDGRSDRLAWDLGDPKGDLEFITPFSHNFGQFSAGEIRHFHPMKGPMSTQTLQDIIGHEPFHWRGDRAGLEAFNPTFVNLQGMQEELADASMQELEDFLATIAFPPNPFREEDNTLPRNVDLKGHAALGRGDLEPGATLPAGDASRGFNRFFSREITGCVHCHTTPTGLGPHRRWIGRWAEIPPGLDGEQHTALSALDRSARHPFKIPSLRNLFDKRGMTYSQTSSQAGFGFLHDGSVDTLVRFIQDGFDFREDRETADMIAFLLAFTGSDLAEGSENDSERPPGLPSQDTHAAAGKQWTTDQFDHPRIQRMRELALASNGRLELIVKGVIDGASRGWFFDESESVYLSDRLEHLADAEEIHRQAGPGNPLTYTLVPAGTGMRLGIDRDADGFPDGVENLEGFQADNALSHPDAIAFALEIHRSRSGIKPSSDSQSSRSNSPYVASLSWRQYPNQKFRIEYKTGLREGRWTPMESARIRTNSGRAAAEIEIEESGARYFRVVRIDSQ